MTFDEFENLLRRFYDAATCGDGETFAACFTEDGVYHDYIYGPHQGRSSIKDMLENLFHRDAMNYHWDYSDAALTGNIGFTRTLSKFTSTIPEFDGKSVVIDGMSQFILKDGLIDAYHESVNGGLPMVQLGVSPERLVKVLGKWSDRLKEREDVQKYLQQ